MKEQKTVLILGASLMQKPAIESALSLGYKTLVVDANPNAVCVPYADRFENIDLKNYKALTELALSLGDSLAAVFTAGTDFSASVSYICEQCGLKSHSLESARNATNKVLMRNCFKKNNVPSPDFLQIDRGDLSLFLETKKLNSIKFPKVIKPVDNMGARGCRLIRNKGEFLGAVESALSNSRSGKAILEDYMEGPEFSIDALVFDKSVTITGFADRHIFFPPYFIETGHTMPSNVSQKIKNELIECFVKGIEALGLTCGAAKADIKYTSKGPMIGEIAARLSGGYMSGWTYPYASQINLTQQALLIALGKKPELLIRNRKALPVKNKIFEVYELPCKNFSAERAWISIPGKIKELLNQDIAISSPFAKNIFIRNYPASHAVFPRNNVEKCGNIINLAPSYEDAVFYAQEAVSNIVLRLEPFNQETDNFLNSFEEHTEKSFPPDAFALDELTRKKFEAEIKNINDVTSEAESIAFLPECLKTSSTVLKDFNHRTMEKTLRMFDKICPFHLPLNGYKFWQAFIRGGLQGILYLNDCTLLLSEQKKHGNMIKKNINSKNGK